MLWSRAATRPDPEKIEALLSRSVAEIIPSGESLRKLLLSGRRLRVKLGIDPTSPHLHIGRAVAILKLKDFQDLGHEAVFIIGDATGVVGDTSDKDAERPMLSPDEVRKNLSEYVAQVRTLLGGGRFEVRRNSEWLLKLDYADIGAQADYFSLSDFIARDNIKRRLDEGKRVSLREVLYPLMQGYDSVAVKADVELGGTDQRFNLLAGRTLQEKSGQAPQHIVMTELIPGTDGRKMSSSWGNTVNVDDAPGETFGKIMGVPDTLVEQYFIHATRMPILKVKELLALHPKDAKLALASEIVRMYHGESEAAKAKEDFIRVFSKGEAPAEVLRVSVAAGTPVVDVLVGAKIVSSKTDWRRLVSEGAVEQDREKITDANATVSPGPATYRVGKHRFVEIRGT